VYCQRSWRKRGTLEIPKPYVGDKGTTSRIEVEIQIKKYWTELPKDTAEQILRDQENAQLALRAHELAREIRERLNIEPYVTS